MSKEQRTLGFSVNCCAGPRAMWGSLTEQFQTLLACEDPEIHVSIESLCIFFFFGVHIRVFAHVCMTTIIKRWHLQLLR